MRDSDGGLPGADIIAIEAAARALKRWRSVSAWCDMHGRVDPKTHEVRPAARYELEGERALQRCLESLGMSPMARSKLGLNIAHGAVLRPRPPLAGAGRCLRATAYSSRPTALRATARSA